LVLTTRAACATRSWPPLPSIALNIAVEEWTGSNGQMDLETLLDEAFGVLRPKQQTRSGQRH
jgi:hypothetical protein